MINIAKPLSHHCSLKVSITKWQHTSLLPRDIFFPATEPTTAAPRYYRERKVCSWLNNNSKKVLLLDQESKRHFVLLFIVFKLLKNNQQVQNTHFLTSNIVFYAGDILWVNLWSCNPTDGILVLSFFEFWNLAVTEKPDKTFQTSPAWGRVAPRPRHRWDAARPWRRPRQEKPSKVTFCRTSERQRLNPAWVT